MSTSVIESTVSTPNSSPALTEKALNWIVSEAQKTEPEFRAERIIELTCQHLASQQNRRKTPFEDFQNYSHAETLMLKRIRFIQEVMRNTLRKMTHGNPDHFNWAKGYNDEITKIGFFRQSSKHRGLDTVDIMKLPEGYKFKGNDVIRFTHTRKNLNKDERVVVLPAELLHCDPIRIAQMVRQECRDFATKNEYSERVAKDAEIAEAKKRLESLEAEMFKLQTRKPMKAKHIKKDKTANKVA